MLFFNDSCRKCVYQNIAENKTQIIHHINHLNFSIEVEKVL